MPEITPKSWIMVGLLGLIWGGAFLLIAIALQGIGPMWLATSRLSIAALAMTAVWAVLGGKVNAGDDPRSRWPYLIGVGLFSSVFPFGLLSWGVQHVTSAAAGVSMATVPLMVLPLAHFLSPGERMNLRKVIGLSIGFVGVALLIGDEWAASSGKPLELYGQLACIAAAGCYAISSIITRRCPPIDTMALTSVSLLVSAVIAIPVALWTEGLPNLPDGQTIAALLVLGLLPTAGAHVLRIMVIRTAGSVFMTLVNYQVPIWSMILGAAILSEPLPANLYGALALILFGMGLSQWASLRQLLRR